MQTKQEAKPYSQSSESEEIKEQATVKEPEPPSTLPAYSEVERIKKGTIFEFDCTATTSASAHSGTHYAFIASYGDSDKWDESAYMDMDYKKYRDDIQRGTRLHVRCKFIDMDYKGAPNFEVIWYRVEE